MLTQYGLFHTRTSGNKLNSSQPAYCSSISAKGFGPEPARWPFVKVCVIAVISALLAQADFFGADLAHQPRWLDDQDGDEDDEPDRLLEGGVDVITGKTLDQADN